MVPCQPLRMPRLALGLLAGVLYGALSAASMLPLQFPDKRAALLGAFLNRLAIGVVVGAVVGAPHVDALRLPPWVIGLAAGVLLSATDAVITKGRRVPRAHSMDFTLVLRSLVCLERFVRRYTRPSPRPGWNASRPEARRLQER
jgi:ribose/xylose/arabinose/galactoside ABC-type transport system permease subunit